MGNVFDDIYYKKDISVDVPQPDIVLISKRESSYSEQNPINNIINNEKITINKIEK